MKVASLLISTSGMTQFQYLFPVCSICDSIICDTLVIRDASNFWNCGRRDLGCPSDPDIL